MTALDPQQDESEFVDIYSGPIGLALTLRATLESAGFLAFIPGENMKTLDPFNTGANCLEVSVQVPTTEIAAVRDFMSATRASVTPDDRDDHEWELERETQAIGSRIRWGTVIHLYALTLIPVPIPWIFAPRYLRLVARMKNLPIGHSLTYAGLIISVALLAGQLTAIAWLVWG